MKRVLLIAAAIALLFSACNSDSNSKHLTKLTLMLDWTPNTNHNGIYVAKEKGWYRDAGIDLQIVQPGQSQSIQSLGAGKVNLAITAQEELLPARAEGAPVVSVAAIIQHNTSSFISLKSKGIQSPADFQGHTYGGYGGQLEDALVKDLVKCDGGDPSKVKFTDIGEADYRVGLENNHYDIVWVFNGWDVIRLRDIDHLDINQINLIEQTKCVPDWYTPIIATNEKTIKNNSDSLKRFMAETKRGYQFSMAHPDEASAILLKAAPELDKNLVEQSSQYLSKRYASDPNRWGYQDAAIWVRFTKFLKDNDVLTKNIDSKHAFTNTFLVG
jgi:ABC-type nitrate/sulfonate/bicarbonate transport system substrate-binding protein